MHDNLCSPNDLYKLTRLRDGACQISVCKGGYTVLHGHEAEINGLKLALPKPQTIEATRHCMSVMSVDV